MNRRADGLAPAQQGSHLDPERRILAAEQRRMRPEAVNRELRRLSRLRRTKAKLAYERLKREAHDGD